ncbi:cytosolic endo-beta-N-acetylglucosaminidase isoform X1 [Vespa velutina]|uniref:cytosolic endo-beta-N-acetylglucosaminidase isoform X1 n=2 Tax=Vespa velutina TaxID=202808 RepID=UPI001FB4A0B3|nr:cytosolic endo-beta-N-acetylglucosaminidase isoform X1 [Vespa velutina]XP_047363270.1 cytosolic endo-beta-N-acetylglucosaminidase isoform X1 [Vespa velutina]
MQSAEMDGNRNQESFPFRNLTELYKGLENLITWPKTTPLRESTEYVHRGLEVHYSGSRLTKVGKDKVPRTLLCHDMKGGYLEDRFINGSNSNEEYLFYHWSIIDTFVYFSHYFVTIPPYGWINAAHSHGVKVLGTVITEHADGEVIWNLILQSEETVRRFANALVQIAKFYKFDGWLLNVENSIKPEGINNLVYFVKYLSDHIHKEIIGSEIIWYDSVINTGELKWQNELNEKNKDFFLGCDGIFLNYNWSDSELINSCILAIDLKRDVKDVYVGLDVWGRGCPGGGGYNSAHALERIRKRNLSVAIFAPGWTHEYFGPKTFGQLEDMFWAQLFPFLYVHIPIYDNERFNTSFCRGSGSVYYRRGVTQSEVFDEKPFYNLSMQKVQISVPVPLLKILGYTEEKPIDDNKSSSKKEALYVYETEKCYVRFLGNVVSFQPKLLPTNVNYFEFSNVYSYEGGGCLKLITKNPDEYHRLFLIYVEFDRNIQGSVVYKAEEISSGISSIIDEPILLLANDSGLKIILPYETFELNAGWRKCVYLTDMKTVNEIGIKFSKESSCYLGEIVLEGKHRRYDRCESADCANRISDYTVSIDLSRGSQKHKKE